MSKTQNEPIEMKENEVYGVSIAALEPERPPQGNVLMSRNINFVMLQFKISSHNNKQIVLCKQHLLIGMHDMYMYMTHLK